MAVESIVNEWEKTFNYTGAAKLAAYLMTHNGSTQAVAVDDGTASFVQTTGGGCFTLNGVPRAAMSADAANVNTEVAYAAWATGTAYLATASAPTSKTEVTQAESDGTVHYACILAHTSSAATEPGVGASWSSYWRKLDRFAVDAQADVIAAGDAKWYLICADVGGFLKVFKAYDSDNALQIPCYDPTRYVAVGLMYADHSSGAADFVIGTTLQSADNHTATYYQVVGPCFPHASLL